MRALSRRSILCSVLVPAVGVPFDLRHPDASLLALSRQFELMARHLDDPGQSVKELLFFGHLHDEIAAAEATTIEGLCAKARAGCWTLLGDFESVDVSATGARMAFSIMRDLIRMRAPHLEQPGAVERLIHHKVSVHE